MADAYTHPLGWKDTVNFPTDPANETAARELLQEQHDEILEFHNDLKAITDAHIIDYIRNPAFGQTTGGTGTPNAYIFSSNPALPSLVDGVSAYLDINVANDGAATLNWDGKGAYPIVDSKGNALVAGKLPLNCIVGVRYNSSESNFQLLGEGGDILTGDAEVGDVLNGKKFYKDDTATQLTGTLSLTGDATVSDVVNGKTFYNTDAKTKLTGTGIFKKEASGSVTSASGILSFTTTGGPASFGYVTVTGLSFTPSMIEVIANDGSNATFYTAHQINSAGASYKITSANFIVQLTGNASVNGTGFQLPVGYTNTAYSWKAIE